jgi:ADP-ribosylglycohydrolase
MAGLTSDQAARFQRARLSIEGLSLGDSFGEHFIYPAAWRSEFVARRLPPAPWRYTDDTEMALGIVEVLRKFNGIDQDSLAQVFALRYAANPHRGYGAGAHDVLTAIGSGVPWREAASQLFDGQGSLGNGGAMRSAPVGAYFADAGYASVAEQARLSAEVTHLHAEGIAGAIAIAVAAAWAARRQHDTTRSQPSDLFATVMEHTPPGQTRIGIERAAALAPETWQHHAAERLGCGAAVTAADTVPFCLWIVARHLDDYTEALWSTVHVGGDVDTNCAIIGGILALAVGEEGLPHGWLPYRESLQWESGLC